MKNIVDQNYKSNLIIKYQKRFIKHRASLFTFIEQDGVLGITIQQKTHSLFSFTKKHIRKFLRSGALHYLLLLGIQNVSLSRKIIF